MMKIRPVLYPTVCGLLLVTAAGCELMYNGSPSVAVTDRHVIQQYQQVKQQQELAGRQSPSQAQPAASEVVAFNAPGSTVSPNPPSTGSTTESTAPPSPSSLGMMRLFGQLPGTSDGSLPRLEGSDNLQKVTFAVDGADFDPDVDPSGATLVYASTRHREAADLYLQTIGESAVRQLTHDPSRDVMPAFSPDGKWIAFASDRSGNWDIFLVSVDGGPAQQLTSSPADEIHPSFSPDGKKVVYCVYGGQSKQWELAVIDLDNPSSPRFIGPGLFPKWSPTDHRIVFQKARERGTRWFSIWTVEFMNGEGLRPTEIAASSNAAAINPAWSRDGRRIVFCTVLNPQSDTSPKPLQSDLWIMNADGSGRSNLTQSRFANLQPVWSADGLILFVSNRGAQGTENIWAMRAEAAVRVASPTIAPGSSSPTVSVPTDGGSNLDLPTP